jgi:hypothetical protein
MACDKIPESHNFLPTKASCLSGAHPSKDCHLKDNDPAKHYCINCKTHGHATHDRLCPAFLKQCNELNTKMPENLYKYCPTNNPITQERLDPSKNDQQQLSDIEENNGWTQVMNKRQKQYTSTQPQRPADNHNKTATSTNTVPLGQRKDKMQTFLDDMGMGKDLA